MRIHNKVNHAINRIHEKAFRSYQKYLSSDELRTTKYFLVTFLDFPMSHSAFSICTIFETEIKLK